MGLLNPRFYTLYPPRRARPALEGMWMPPELPEWHASSFPRLGDPAIVLTISDHGRPQNLSLSRRDGMDALVAQPREGVLTTRRFPLSSVLGTVRA